MPKHIEAEAATSRLSLLDQVIYSSVTGAAALCGLVFSCISLFVLDWGGRNPTDANRAGIFGNLATVSLIIGAIASASNRAIFPILTIAGSIFFPSVIVAIEVERSFSDFSEILTKWQFLTVLLIDLSAIGLSFAKLKQLGRHQQTSFR